jgi:hypothetical protein
VFAHICDQSWFSWGSLLLPHLTPAPSPPSPPSLPNFTKDAEGLKEQHVKQLADGFDKWMANKIDDETLAQIQTEFALPPPPGPSSNTLQPMLNPNPEMMHPIVPNVPPADDLSTLPLPLPSP